MAMIMCETCNDYFGSAKEFDEHEYYCKKITALRAKLTVAVEALEWIKNPEYFDKSCIPVINEALCKIKVDE